MFENSMKLVDDCGLTFLHVFPYSKRPGTPAAKMPQVDGAVIKERARQLREAGEARLVSLCASAGRERAGSAVRNGHAWAHPSVCAGRS
jgi:threonylcarbamoyladenosine tRNA methylthiotransferase MtaB